MIIEERLVKEKVLTHYKKIMLTEDIAVEKKTIEVYENDNLKNTNSISYIVSDLVFEHARIELFDKNVRELHRQHNIFQKLSDDTMDVIFKYIKDPFSIVEELGDSWSDR